MNLDETLISKLQNPSARFRSNTNQAVNYVPVSRAAGGIVPSGIYKIAGENVAVKLVLRQDDKEIARLEVKADKKEIVGKLLRVIVESARKMNV